MKKGIALAAILLVSLSCADLADAAGFRLPDQDLAAMGMGGAFVAQADNPSALWYNPAGILQLGGTRYSAGGLGIYPVMKHENQNGTTDVSERAVHVPAMFFVTDRVNDNLAWGVGITSPFGLSTNWSPYSSTSRIATFSRVKCIDLNPNIAYKMSDRLSIGLGIDYIMLQATLDKMLDAGTGFRLDGEGSGLGANAGLLYKATDELKLGLSYRSRVKVKVDDATATVSGALAISNPVATEITLPDLIQVGGSYKASDKLTLNADLEYTWWSTYDRLVMRSDTFIALTGGATDTVTDEKQWENTWIFRAGGQYRLSDEWKLRAGYVYDQTPVPDSYFDTRTPDSDRQGFTLGTGYNAGNVTIDASYMYLLFTTRTITDSLADDATATPDALNGTYRAEAHLFGMAVAYHF
ncbi:MAG: hypothetical protein A2078_06125 [Nitrospirae bacterium GWC2_57_9]|nr:MAG: hypothetical protein A2078_06125 [Nitrospirae bacterium GWC2_57_9]